MRFYTVSDLHTDYKDNLEWCKELSQEEWQEDTLLIAGDISDDLSVLRNTLQILAARFAHVFFVPGNHDLWVRKGDRDRFDSIGKLDAIREVCRDEGVSMEPACLDGVWVVPLLAWYHATWDTEPDVAGALPAHKMMVDFHACRWPDANLNADDDSLARFFDALNDQPLAALQTALQQGNAIEKRPPIITFSHFLSHQRLLPEKRLLRHPNLAKAVGSDCLAARIAELQPTCHCFGHTHFSWDAVMDGTRYVQWPLAYPAERRHRTGGGVSWQPLCIWDTALDGGATPATHTYWSQHYRYERRDPSNVQPAPWCCVR